MTSSNSVTPEQAKNGCDVLLLSLVFAPDGVSTAVIMTELAEELVALGHRVTVLTTTPHYNVEPEGRSRQKLQRRLGGMLYESHLPGIRVLHARVPSKAQRVLSRLLEYGWFHLASTLLAGTTARKYDVVLAPSPPLTIGVNAWMLALSGRVPFVYNVQEIYPDVAVRLGVLTQPRLIRLAERLERFIYDRSTRITVISEQFREILRRKGVADDKLVVIPNFVDADFVRPQPQANPFSESQDLAGRFVALYAGNLGLTQDLDGLLEAAEHLRDEPEIRFLVVGGGNRYAWMKAELERMRLPNVLLLPYQPRSRVPEIYASAAVGLIPMKPATTRDTFPSKVYTIMSAGRPVIGATEQDTELARVIGQAGAGVVVPPGDGAALGRAIRAAYEDEAGSAAQGARGREWVEAHHTRSVVARQYDQLIRSLTGRED